MKSERTRLTLTLVGIGAAGLLTAGLLFQLAHPAEPELNSPAIVVSKRDISRHILINISE